MNKDTFDEINYYKCISCPSQIKLSFLRHNLKVDRHFSGWQSTTGDDWKTLNFRKIHLLPKEKCVEQLGTQKARHNLKNSMHFRLLHAPRTTLISGWPTRSRSASCENVGKFVEDTVGSIETNCLLSPFAESARESDMVGERGRGRQMPKRQLK